MENTDKAIGNLITDLYEVIELTFGTDYVELLDNLDDYDSSELMVYTYYLEDATTIEDALYIFSHAIEEIKEVKNKLNK